MAKTGDKFFDEAVEMFIGKAGGLLGKGVFPSIGARDGTRTSRARDAQIGGAVPLFSNHGAIITNLNSYENDRYNAAMLWDFCNNILLPYLDRLPSETPEEFAERPGKVTVNYFRLLVDILSQLYNGDPGRRFYDPSGKAYTGGPIDLVTKAYRQGGANTMMGIAEQYRHVFGHCLVRPVFINDRWRLAIHPKPDYDIITREVNGENEIVAVVLTEIVEYPEEKVNSPVWRLGKISHVWTANTYGTFVDGAAREIEANRYGRIPYAYMPYDENYATRFRQRDMTNEALLNSEFNEELSLLNYHFRFATNPVTVIADDINRVEEDLKMVPGLVLTMRSHAEGTRTARLEFAVPQDRINSGKIHLGTALEQIFRPWGINYTISEGIKAGVSGLAVEVSMAPVLSHLSWRAENSKQAELDLYGLWKSVAKIDAKESWPEVSEIDVSYQYGESFRSRQERREDTRFELDAGLIDRAQALFERHPERFSTVEEARAALPDEKEIAISRGSEIGGFASDNGVRINRPASDRQKADEAASNMGGGEKE